ncbi:MAG: YbhB/YbcL family Raf kinase inhibitor-like protein [Candidatus Eisenbacteria bacterium]|nr:YbhB/YbcL family Raf kinase inhibitor-like protein [Candidatus Eisenbacteria bacterium]
MRIGVLMLATILAAAPAEKPTPQQRHRAAAAMMHRGFMLMSAEIHPGEPIGMEQVYKGMSCDGGNISPSLAWRGAPRDTKSFAVTVFDPDAPTGSGWWHWIVYDIPADSTRLAADAGRADGSHLPPGAAQGVTDFGAPGYGGPCPPPGKPHHYVFTLFALDVAKLGAPAGATAAHIGFLLNGHALAKATLTGIYGR